MTIKYTENIRGTPVIKTPHKEHVLSFIIDRCRCKKTPFPYIRSQELEY
jgi:hypothetical protein